MQNSSVTVQVCRSFYNFSCYVNKNDCKSENRKERWFDYCYRNAQSQLLGGSCSIHTDDIGRRINEFFLLIESIVKYVNIEL